MSINEYAELVKKQVESTLENVTVTVMPYRKQNRDCLTSISICEKGTDVSATFCVDEVYTMGCSVEVFADKLCKMYEKERENRERVEQVRQTISDYTVAKELLVPTLMSVEKNEELLKTIPHIQFSDLALFLSLIPKETDLWIDNMEWSVMVTQRLMQGWGYNFEELLKQAIQNASYHMFSMREMLAMECPDMSSDTIFDIVPEDVPMHVCTSERGFKGAAGMFLPGAAKMVSQKMESNLIIIPSSIHETIVTPIKEAEGVELDEYVNMVQDVNKTTVEEPEFLSDSAYLYDRETDLFRNLRTEETFSCNLKDMPMVTMHMDSKSSDMCDIAV